MTMKIFATLILTFLAAVTVTAQEYSREKIWEKEISAYLEIDKTQTPPSKAILFTGSSSMLLWKTLRVDFPHLNVMNRGFGGSHIEDLVFFAPKIVLPYKPKKIVVYSGENDIESGRTPEAVLADFKAFIAIRDKNLAGTPIIYISMKPSILRWGKWPEMKRANDLIAAESAKHKKVTFIDVSKVMLGTDGKPMADHFVSDGLHLSGKGYAAWRELLLPHLK